MNNTYIDFKNPEEEFNKLLNIKYPWKYALCINNKFKSYKQKNFWNTIVRYFYCVIFEDLPEDVLYEYKNVCIYD